MDLDHFNDLFLGVIDFYFPDLAYLGPGSGGPTNHFQILIAGSSVVQIHSIRTESFNRSKSRDV